MMDVDGIIVALSLLLTAVGVVDCVRAMNLINKEQERLRDYCDIRKAPGQFFEDGLLEDSEQRQLLALLDAQEKESGGLLLVDQRWAAMLKAVKAENAVRKVPSFTSLRAINLQQSYASHAVWLRIVMPMLLVLGILGTLAGVHAALGMPVQQDHEQQRLMECVSEALLPGILATFCTILLMLCRGMYRMKFNRMMRELDNMTLCVFLPSLQIQSHLGATIDEFCSQIGKLAVLGTICNEIHAQLERSFGHVSEVCQEMCRGKGLLEISRGVSSLGRLFSLLLAQKREYAAGFVKLISAMDRLREWQVAFPGYMDQVMQLAGAAAVPGDEMDSAEGSVEAARQAPIAEVNRLCYQLGCNAKSRSSLCKTVNQHLWDWSNGAAGMWKQFEALFEVMEACTKSMEVVAGLAAESRAALLTMQSCLEGVNDMIPAFRAETEVLTWEVVSDHGDEAFSSYQVAFGSFFASCSLLGDSYNYCSNAWEKMRSAFRSKKEFGCGCLLLLLLAIWSGGYFIYCLIYG